MEKRNQAVLKAAAGENLGRICAEGAIAAYTSGL